MPFDINSFLSVLESVLTARHLGLIHNLWLCKVHSGVSDTLSQALCNLSLADLTLSDSTALIRFISLVPKPRPAFRLGKRRKAGRGLGTRLRIIAFSQITLCYSFGSKDMITAFTCLPSYRYSSFTLRAYHCGGILPVANNGTRKERFSQEKNGR